MVEQGEFDVTAQQGWNFVRSVDQRSPAALKSGNLFQVPTLSPWTWVSLGDALVTRVVCEVKCLCHGQILMDPYLKSPLTWVETRHVTLHLVNTQ